ncbi:MAG: type II toxin-antitoxin system RelE/ParE family toxin [Bacteroidales bacterium]|jgi:plasmid stabilization system protein ParE|nr:type II toxin-antitoxin system RelE/ParE family toxin [Bacteroidales bacterium]
MKVIWTELAKQQMRHIAKYIRINFGVTARKNFTEEIRHTNLLLATHPNIGVVEPLLDDCAKTYRSFVIKRHDKIVYHVGDDRIEVVAFWDCRQDPERLVSQIKTDKNTNETNDQ